MHLVVAAILQHRQQVLLVQQKGAGDPGPSWALPGGVVENGELLAEAIVREVREETGLTITDPGRILYTVQVVEEHDDPYGEASRCSSTTLAMIFEAGRWRGNIKPTDPDGLILTAEFTEREEAIRRLNETLPFIAMRDPVVSALRGETAPGTLWLYRRVRGGQDRLIIRLPVSTLR